MSTSSPSSAASSSLSSFEPTNPLQPPSPSSSSSSSPSCEIDKLPAEIFQHCIMRFLETFELGIACRVSKGWQKLIDKGAVWKDASIREGVPLVEVVDGRPSDYKGDFRFLRSITISSKIIGRYFGEVVGKVPCICLEHYLQLKDGNDPFDHTKSMRENYIVLVDPHALKIKVGPNRPLALDGSGTLVEVPVVERATIAAKDLIVPFSFKNLRMLAQYPLEGGNNGPVFNSRALRSEVFDQCNAPSAQDGILIIRREVVARNMPLHGDKGQKAFVTKHGWKIMTVRQRGFFNAIEILSTGACHDSRNPWTYARSDEPVRSNHADYIPDIGGFAPGVGVGVAHYSDFARDDYGVVPGVPAEVQDIGT